MTIRKIAIAFIAIQLAFGLMIAAVLIPTLNGVTKEAARQSQITNCLLYTEPDARTFDTVSACFANPPSELVDYRRFFAEE